MSFIKKMKQKAVLWFADKFLKKLAKENKMIGKLLSWMEGKKTYLFALGWTVYKIGVGAGWWAENPLVEPLLLGGGAAALREGVKKAEKK